MKTITAIININTGSNITTCVHKKVENKRGSVITIEVECDNVDDYPYNYPLPKSKDILRSVFKGFNDTFSGKK